MVHSQSSSFVSTSASMPSNKDHMIIQKRWSITVVRGNEDLRTQALPTTIIKSFASSIDLLGSWGEGTYVPVWQR